ncbi:FHA domain-containing protein, partial [bacterium]
MTSPESSNRESAEAAEAPRSSRGGLDASQAPTVVTHGTAERFLEALAALRTTIPETSRDLANAWGTASAPEPIARLTGSLERFALEALYRATATTRTDAELLLRAVAGPLASLSQASLDDLTATLAGFQLGDLPSDLRAIVEDIKSPRSTFVQLVELCGLASHAVDNAAWAIRDGNGACDRLLSLATKLGKILSAEATLSLKELLVVRDGTHRAVRIGARFVLSGALVLGRSPSCNVVVDDHDCSRRHARIVELAGRGGPAVLHDESRNGTFLNGQRIDGSRLLTDGDLIRVGNV